MAQETVDFQDLKDLKFKIGHMNCQVHQRQFGFDDFWVEFKLNKTFMLSWEHSNRLVTLLRFKKGSEYSIEERIPVKNLEEVRKYLYVFGHLTKEQYSSTNIYSAA